MGQAFEAEFEGNSLMFGYDGVKDMFDGGGAGQSGTSFSGGGLLSSAANRVATPRGSRTSGGEMRPQSRPDMGAMMQRQQSQQKPTFFQDMFDGGGMGATGDSFKGAGLYSGLLNMLGIKPMGAQDRATMASFQSAQNAPPAVMQAIQRAQAPMTSPMPQTGAVGLPAVPSVRTYPANPFGDMMMRLERDGIQPAYNPMPMYGPR